MFSFFFSLSSVNVISFILIMTKTSSSALMGGGFR